MHIVADISGHGFGHAAQIAPLLRRFRESGADLLIRSSLPAADLHRIIGFDVACRPLDHDIGLLMQAPDRPDLERSLAAYQRLHADFGRVADEEARELEQLGAELLLSDICYAGLAGAARLGLPAFALCSLHWAEIFQAYFPQEPCGDRIVAEMVEAYSLARAFFVPFPRQEVPWVEQQRPVGLMVRREGRRRRDALEALFPESLPDHVGLVSFGGIGQGLPDVQIPPDESWAWLVPDSLALVNPGSRTLPLSRVDHIDWLDLVASVDLVVTKTGYSTFAECLHYGVRCLFISRPDWPEAAQLESVMTEGGWGQPISRESLAAGDWGSALQAAPSGPAQWPLASGDTDAHQAILALL